MHRLGRWGVSLRSSRASRLAFDAWSHYFGEPRQDGSSHAIFKTPWAGDPRTDIQDDKGKAKPYRVRQVPLAIQKLEDTRNAS